MGTDFVLANQEAKRLVQQMLSTLVTPDAAPRTLYGYSTPSAVYDATANKTFVVYAKGPGRYPYATYYDHATGEWASEVQIASDYPIGPEDNHGPAVLAVDNDGYLHVFYGAHSTVERYAKSTNPRDISAWAAAVSIPATAPVTGDTLGITYPHLTCEPATGNLYAVGRSGSTHNGTYPGHEFSAFIKSTDGGSTWTSIGPIVDLTGYSGDAAKDFYVSHAEWFAGKLHIVWVVAHGAAHDGPRDDVFYAYYDPATGHMFSAANADLGTKATGTAARIYTHGYVSAPRMCYRTSDSTLFIVFNEYVSGESKLGYRVAKIAAGAVTTADTGIRTNSFYHMGALRLNEDGTTLELYVVDGLGRGSIVYQNDVAETPLNSRSAGADLSWYTSANGTSWTRQGLIADGSKVPAQGVENVFVPRNAAAGCKVLYQGAGLGFTPSHLPLYMATDKPVKIARTVGRNATVAQASPKQTMAWLDSLLAYDTVTAPTTGSYVQAALATYLPRNVVGVRMFAVVTMASGTGIVQVQLREQGTTRRSDAIFAMPIIITGQAIPSPVFEVPVSAAGSIEYKVTFLGGVSPTLTSMQFYLVGFLY